MNINDEFVPDTPDVLNDVPPPSFGDVSKCTDNHKNKLREWLRKGINYKATYNIRHQRLDRKADLFYEMKTHLVPSFNGLATRYSPHLSEFRFDKDDPGYFPLTTYDEFSGPLQNEAARLGRPEYQAYIRPEGENPGVEEREGAKIAKAAVRQSLKEMRWEETQDRGLFAMPAHGEWWLYSYWDASWEETTRIAVIGALECPECDFKLASASLSKEQAAPFADRVDVQEEPNPKEPGTVLQKFSTSVCLTCEPKPETDDMGEPVVDEMGAPVMQGPPSLQEHVATGEGLYADDHFGNPLGEDVPLGRWKLRTLNAHEVFVADYGIDTTPDKIDEFWLCHVESLDWIRNRYDNGARVRPENPAKLLEFHPVMGERELWSDARQDGSQAFRNRCRVMEYHRKPSRRPKLDDSGQPVKDAEGTPVLEMDKGRSLVMAGDVVLLDDVFMIPSKVNPGQSIPRCHLDVAQFDLRSAGQELRGVALAERLFPGQEDGDELMGMLKDTWQMQGTPKWLVERGMQLDFDVHGGAGGQYLFSANPAVPNLAPKQLESQLMAAPILGILERITGYMSRVAHTNEVEGGQPPPGGVWPALALQIMAEQSNEKRKPRLRRIREMLERCFRHGLILMQELVREPRPLWVEGENGEEEQIAWQGLMLKGQVNARIDAEPDIDSDTIKSQTIRDLMQLAGPLGQQWMQSKRFARYVAEAMGAPVDEMFQREKLQTGEAEREYNDYMRDGKEPLVDPETDDHEEHDDCHGIDMLGEKWRTMEDKAGVDSALMFLEDWEKNMAPIPSRARVQTEMGPVMQTTMIPNPMWQTIEMSQDVPPALELRILALWSLMLMQRQIPLQKGTELYTAFRWRAHKAAHRIYAQRKQQAAQAGVAVMAAPAADQTAGGTIPTAGAPAQEQGMVQ